MSSLHRLTREGFHQIITDVPKKYLVAAARLFSQKNSAITTFSRTKTFSGMEILCLKFGDFPGIYVHHKWYSLRTFNIRTWLIWVPAGVDPRFAGCQSVTLTTELLLVLMLHLESSISRPWTFLANDIEMYVLCRTLYYVHICSTYPFLRFDCIIDCFYAEPLKPLVLHMPL